ncbi:unnamed protein product [Closterium sp. NIES-64]|nr:unnamed protein product [Closterium sp. NIES-64]
MECLAHRAPAPVALANPKVEHRLPASSASLKFAASPALGSKLVAKTRQAARASQPQLRRTTPRCEAAPEGAALTAPEKKSSSDDTIQQFLQRDYKYGFVSNIENVQIPKGLTEETVRLISAKKREPEWMLEFRLSAFRQWQKMTEPEWSDNRYPKIDFQDVIYYSEPKQKETKASLDEVDPELLATFDKLGISISEQKRLANVAVDVVFDSVSIATTFREELAKAGVIFCSISEAVREYPDLVRKYLGKVVPVADNYYAALNSAVFSDGSFCYIPKDTISPMELSTYFRINAMETGQFERTLIVADDRSYVSYLEGCTAPSYDKNQLHAAVVELWTGEGAEIKYSTVQNWYAGDKDGVGGIYNFVTKRGLCEGKNSKISWTQVETGSAITWKYPSVVLKGDNSSGEFYSVALTNNKQQADTGTKMIHVGKNTRSRIVSKGISAGQSLNCYRGLVQVQPTAHGARNYSQCDSMLIGDNAGANTYPYIQVKDPTARVEHEASTSKIGEDQLFYFQQRGIDAEKAVGMLISGFCREVFNELPLEFASEVNQLMSLKLEGSVAIPLTTSPSALSRPFRFPQISAAQFSSSSRRQSNTSGRQRSRPNDRQTSRQNDRQNGRQFGRRVSGDATKTSRRAERIGNEQRTETRGRKETFRGKRSRDVGDQSVGRKRTYDEEEKIGNEKGIEAPGRKETFRRKRAPDVKKQGVGRKRNYDVEENVGSEQRAETSGRKETFRGKRGRDMEDQSAGRKRIRGVEEEQTVARHGRVKLKQKSHGGVQQQKQQPGYEPTRQKQQQQQQQQGHEQQRSSLADDTGNGSVPWRQLAPVHFPSLLPVQGTAVGGRVRDGGGVREEGRSRGVRYRAGIIREDDEEGGVDTKGADAGVVSARKWVAVCCPHMPTSLVNKLFRKRLVSASQLLLPGTILCIPSSVQLHTDFEASAATRAVASSVSSAAPSSSFSSLPRGIQPEDVKMLQKCVLYKDEHILVINKPPGLPSQVTPALPGNACPPR